MTLKHLLSFMSSQERTQNPDQGLVISRRLKELLETTEVRPSTTTDRNDRARHLGADGRAVSES
jgi:hypothetical protein